MFGEIERVYVSCAAWESDLPWTFSASPRILFRVICECFRGSGGKRNYSASGKHSQLFTFSTFYYVTASLQNGTKWNKLIFSSKYSTQHPIMTMLNKFIFIFLQKWRHHKLISIHNLCSILNRCTFSSNYSLKSLWIWCHKSQSRPENTPLISW